MSSFLRAIIIGVTVAAAFSQVLAQSNLQAGNLKQEQKNLMGKWQLVGTTVQGQFHEVKKSGFDAVITFEAHHKYREEVFYESDHWIIEGKWIFDPNNDTLAITSRNCIAGSAEKKPEDIVLHLSWLNTSEWVGEGNEKGQPVKLYYQNLNEHLR